MRSTDYLESKGIEFRLVHLEEVPKSTQDVERLFGCKLCQVLKTLVFVGNNEPVLAVVQGDKRVDIDKLAKAPGQETLSMANPSQVKEITGYMVGGVTPFGAKEGIKKVIDSKVFEEEKVNIGSGKAEIGIELRTNDLRKAWEGIIVEITSNFQ